MSKQQAKDTNAVLVAKFQHNLADYKRALYQKVASATNPADRQMYQRQIAATDRAIDRLVCTLYNLTEEEIKIVEGAGE